MLRFVSSGTRYGTYLDRDGEEVYLLNGTTTRLIVEFDFDEAHQWWSAQDLLLSSWEAAAARFDLLKQRYLWPSDVDDNILCIGCLDLTEDDDYMVEPRYGNPGGRICDSCRDDSYTFCERCSGLFHNDDMEDVGNGNGFYVCSMDRGDYYSHCGYCGWYSNDYDCDCSGDEDCNCDAPGQVFTMPNGMTPVQQGEKVVVTMAAGIISEEGLNEISRLLSNNRLVAAQASLPSIGNEWQNRKGNFTKRLSRAAHQTTKGDPYYQRLAETYLDDDGTPHYPPQGVIPPQVLTEVGNIARDHSKSADTTVLFTRDLNGEPEDYGHSGSCWWSDYNTGRCSLKQNGGMAMLSYNNKSYPSSVTGRAWVLPLRLDVHGSLVATFSTTTPDAYIVFNGYGDLGGYTPARVICQMNGMTYRKIDFYCDPMYINAGGYLVGSEETVAPYTDSSLTLHMDYHSSLFQTEQAAALATQELANV